MSPELSSIVILYVHGAPCSSPLQRPVRCKGGVAAQSLAVPRPSLDSCAVTLRRLSRLPFKSRGAGSAGATQPDAAAMNS